MFGKIDKNMIFDDGSVVRYRSSREFSMWMSIKKCSDSFLVIVTSLSFECMNVVVPELLD